MLRVFRSLLYLYPPAYRAEFADEMAGVFLQAQSDIRHTSLSRVAFYAREVLGLFTGAMQTHLRNLFGFHDWLPLGRWSMRPGFRFPRSTVFLMSAILLGVVLAIDKAKDIVRMKAGLPPGTVDIWDPVCWSGLFALGLVLATVAVVWGVLFALRRTGMHRLSNIGAFSGRDSH